MDQFQTQEKTAQIFRKTSKKISREDDGNSVLQFLTRKFTYLSESEWKNYINEKRVLVNGTPARLVDIVCAGDRIETVFPFFSEPPVDARYEILYEDEALTAVGKPGNLPCHPGGKYFRNTLWHLLRNEGNRGGLHFVHRLDRETSGVVIVAKSPAAADNLRIQFQSGRVEKRYFAIVSGCFPLERAKASGHLVRDFESAVRKKRLFVPSHENVPMKNGAKWCVTYLRGVRREKGYSLVEAIPKTGRPHQIRATLFALGYPIVGDKLYGPDDTIFLRFIKDAMTAEDLRILQLDRQALHAYKIRICHPESGEQMSFQAAVPEEWSIVCPLANPGGLLK